MISDESIARGYPLAWIRQTDFFSRVKPLIESGRWEINSGGKIAMTSSGIEHDIPWIRVRSSPRMRCGRHFDVLFRCFNVIPRFCFGCYKVVVRPRTLVELFKLLETLRGLPEEIHSKCGIEVREYVPALYGGYVYARGADEGRARHKLVAEAVADRISPEVPVYLKRSCTEFELEHGDPDTWREKAVWTLCEKWVDEHFVFPEKKPGQLPFIQNSIMRGWFDYAHSVGDMSYLLLSGGEPLHAPSAVKEDRDGGP